MRRIACVWLRRFATDRSKRAHPAEPLALSEPATGGLRLTAVDAAAEAAGLFPGMLLSDARALCPGLAVRPADPAGDAKALDALAQWALRYTPLPAVDRPHGLFLDISGCAHLFGGEAAMLEDMTARLAGLGYEACAGLADTAGAAWAAARTGVRATVVPAGKTAAWLADRPLAALRLDPATVDRLARLGVKTAGRLAALPRAALAARFGSETLLRLDRALGRADEPLSFAAPAPRYGVRAVFAEPLGHLDGIAQTAERLSRTLAAQLEKDGAGGRRFTLVCHRTDGRQATLEVRSARACRDPAHLSRLFAERLRAWEPEFDPGFGFEVITLSAWRIERLDAAQLAALAEEAAAPACRGALDRLIDRLANRLPKVSRPVARPAHIPERAAALATVLEKDAATAGPGTPWSGGEVPLRPPTLLPRPEPVEVTAEVPEGPPLALVWRRVAHRIRRAEGPERIAAEWWAACPGAEPLTRDYYRIETAGGRRLWVFREGLYRETGRPRWYVHGLFP